MKKLLILIIVVGGLAYGGYKTYFWAAPSVTIVNKTSSPIKKAYVYMGKNRLSFSSVAPKQSIQIYRGVRQIETMYRYEIVFEGGEKLKGGCGKVLPNEYFVNFVITPISKTEAECSQID
jgi:hypothetical protein